MAGRTQILLRILRKFGIAPNNYIDLNISVGLKKVRNYGRYTAYLREYEKRVKV